MTKDLLDNGATCILDLLHIYTSKMSSKLKLPLNIPPGVNVDLNHVQAVMEAWTDECSEFIKTVKENCLLKYCSAMFSDLEIQLIKNLLDLVYIFCQCSCDIKLETVEDETLKKLESVNSVGDKHKDERKSTSANRKLSSEKSDSPLNAQFKNPPLSDTAKQYQVRKYVYLIPMIITAIK